MNTIEKLKALSAASTPGPTDNPNVSGYVDRLIKHMEARQELDKQLHNCLPELIAVVEAADYVASRNAGMSILCKALNALERKVTQ